jgi:deoxyribose-phosphate aldolase
LQQSSPQEQQDSMNTTTVSIAEPPTFDAAAFASQALFSAESLAAILDHSLLKPEATRAQIVRLCHEAAEHRFACATVNPAWAGLAVETLAGTGIPVSVVVGFPLGASLPESRSDEARRVLKLGARELDLAMHVGLLKSGTREDFEAVRKDLRGVVEPAHGAGAMVKVILETCLLTFEEKHRAAEIALAAGADYIQTSTGFSTGGATVDDITLIRSIAGSGAGVKAAGGIRSLADASAMLHAGATRIGASASVKIVAELRGR